MKKYHYILIIVAIAVLVFFSLKSSFNKNNDASLFNKLGERVAIDEKGDKQVEKDSGLDLEDGKMLEVVASNLNTPWSLVILDNDNFLISERPGDIKLIDKDGRAEIIGGIAEVRENGEGGLLGLAKHPDFSNNHYIYAYYTYVSSNGDRYNKVIRFKYQDKKISDREDILDKIPAGTYHNGGRIKFGPDNYLYISTGDAQNSESAQNTSVLSGKILRVDDLGNIVSDNPFDNEVYSYGHRNVQGLAWDDEGNLFASEHGRSGLLSGYDELNKIEKDYNYGWPDIQGDESREGMQTPLSHSGPKTTWAPSGLAYKNGYIYFVGLRGAALYRVNVSNLEKIEVEEFFKSEYGRLRDVVSGEGDYLYILTNNTDGRGNPDADDDLLLKVDSSQL